MADLPGDGDPGDRTQSLGEVTGVHQLAVVYRPLAELVPYVRNARKHSPTQIAKMKASLMEFGWANVMLVAEDQMIAGHARLAAALELRAEGKVIPHIADQNLGPTIDLSHLTPEQRKAYILADNRLAEEAVWDNELLRIELEDLGTAGFSFEPIGFDIAEIEAIRNGWQADAAPIDAVEAELSGVEATIRIRCLQQDRETVVAKITEALTGIEHVGIS